MNDQPITLRPARADDRDALAGICFEAFDGVNARHGFPPDFPAVDAAAGLMSMMFELPHVYGVVAEQGGRVVGSNFLWRGGPVASGGLVASGGPVASGCPVAGVGPITVAPGAQGGVGRRLMEDVLARAADDGTPSVRLVQAAFNTTSMSLYTKLGFDVREPLVCLNGPAIGEAVPGHAVRRATAADVAACGDVCRRVHGHDRSGELHAALEQGTALVVERGGRVVGYASDVGFFGHTVALDNAGLTALIGGAARISGPGLLLPSRNGEAFRWCLARGLRVVQPMTLMSLGLYNEPRGAFCPSILY